MMVTKTTQLHIATPDEIGQLAMVLGVIGKSGVNILSYAGYSQDNAGHILIVTEDNSKALELLQGEGYEVHQSPVAVVRESDLVGQGASLAEKIADAGLNLTLAYATAAGGEYITIYQAEDVDALVSALS